MKKLLIALILVLSIIGVTGCTDQFNQEMIPFDEVELLNLDVEDMSEEDMNDISEYPRLQLYLEQLIESKQNLDTLKTDITVLVEDIKLIRDNLQAQSVELNEEDRMVVVDALRSVRFNRFMFNQTIGQAYQQLVDLKENKDQYDQEATKDILIDVYNVLKTREALLNDIHSDLIIIHSIISTY